MVAFKMSATQSLLRVYKYQGTVHWERETNIAISDQLPTGFTYTGNRILAFSGSDKIGIVNSDTGIIEKLFTFQMVTTSVQMTGMMMDSNEVNLYVYGVVD